MITPPFTLFHSSESREYLSDLTVEPASLSSESFREGFLSAQEFYNVYHAGFCGPYIANPNYLLIIDFR